MPYCVYCGDEYCCDQSYCEEEWGEEVSRIHDLAMEEAREEARQEQADIEDKLRIRQDN